MNELLGIDVWLLRLLNVDLANPILDQVWLQLTHLERQSWFAFGVLPLLLGLGFYIYRMSLGKLLFVLALAVGLADLFSYRVVKSVIMRPRPSSNIELSGWLRPVGDAHGLSFPSNHAANCFAGAVILAWYFRRGAYYFYTIAGLIGLSRVALGVHYPSDVLGGIAIGVGVGFLIRMTVLERAPRFWQIHASMTDQVDSEAL